MCRILTFLMCLAVPPALAQTHYFGFKGGGGWTNVTQENFVQNNENRSVLSGGFYYLLELENKFQFGLDLIYTQKGFIKEVRAQDNFGRWGQIMDHKYNFDYISLPLKAGFTIGGKVGAFANLGVAPAFLIKGEIVENTYHNIENKKQNVTTDANRFDIGVLLELGGFISVADNAMFTLSVACQQDLISITNDNFYDGSEARYYGVLIQGGVKFVIKTKQETKLKGKAISTE